MRPSEGSEGSDTRAAEGGRRPTGVSHPICSHDGMATKPPTQPPLTLFDVSQFEFETDHTAKTPSRPPSTPLATRGLAGAGAARRIASAEAVKARRRRARARLAKRRYLADTEGYERIEQTRRAMHLVAD